MFGKGVSRRICVVILCRNLRFCLVTYGIVCSLIQSSLSSPYSHLHRQKFWNIDQVVCHSERAKRAWESKVLCHCEACLHAVAISNHIKCLLCAKGGVNAVDGWISLFIITKDYPPSSVSLRSIACNTVAISTA